jgi:hypothetical protein
MVDKGATVVGDGPAAELARALRKLHKDRGFTSQGQLARKCKYSPKTISLAFKGAARPSWDVTKAIVVACGVSSDDIDPWKVRWAAAQDAWTVLHDLQPKGAVTSSKMTELLAEAMRRRAVTVDMLLDKAAGVHPPQIDGKPDWSRPSRAAIGGALTCRDRPVCRHVVMLALTVCGASHDDLTRWLKCLPRPVATCTCDGPPDIAAADGSALPVEDRVEEAAATPIWRNPWAVRRGRLAAVAVIGAATLGAALPFALSARPTTEKTSMRAGRIPGIIPATPSPAASPSQPPDPAEGRPARQVLAGLAIQVAREPEESASGSVDYLHRKTWHLEETSGIEEPFTVRDEQLWRSPDGSGLFRVTALPPDGADPGTVPTGSVSTRSFPANSLPTAADEPNTDPGILAANMRTMKPGTGDAAATLQTAAQLYRYHCMRPAQRAALLRILADTADVRTLGVDKDRLGRDGLQIIAADSRGTIQYRAVFDTATGALLSMETLRIPATVTALSAPTVTDATAFYACEHRTSLN